ncbi:MAG: hypothetical protein M1826_006244 [Phylliscum demangeonii]|nr:MAG: hypothetical protein M1826_006244 [Phylliscum demangeonii]
MRYWRATRTGHWRAWTDPATEYNRCIDDPKNKIPRGQSTYAVWPVAGRDPGAIDVASTRVHDATPATAADEGPAPKAVLPPPPPPPPPLPEDRLAAIEHRWTPKAGHQLRWAQGPARALSHQTARFAGASARAWSSAAVKNLGREAARWESRVAAE